MISVALIGPDGAGKSTICRRLLDEPLPAPARAIYMGVNLEASTLMLPTTRLALALKRGRGGRPDLVASAHRDVPPDATGSARQRALRGARSAARIALWVLEEWFRQVVALGHRMRGRIVVFDRHFYADYYHHDVVAAAGRPPSARLHGFLLRHLYPKPDLVICLDAPGEVLYRRKQEATPEWLERRRREYLELATVLPGFVVVDVDRPLDVVVRDIAGAVIECWTRRCAAPFDGARRRGPSGAAERPVPTVTPCPVRPTS